MRVMSVVILLVVVAAASAQYISSYAPRPHIYPAPREPARDTSLDNRFGGTEAPLVDRFGLDASQVNKAEEYPEESKPFWLKNKEAIASHIGLNPAPNPAPNAAAGTPSIGNRARTSS